MWLRLIAVLVCSQVYSHQGLVMLRCTRRGGKSNLPQIDYTAGGAEQFDDATCPHRQYRYIRSVCCGQ